MPQFSIHTPATQSDLAKARKVNNLKQNHFPVGVIGDSNGFSWGYDGDTYYVAEGVFEHLVTKMALSLEEAKQLFNALVFSSAYEPSNKVVVSAIKAARKVKLSGDDLMWKLIDLLGVK